MRTPALCLSGLITAGARVSNRKRFPISGVVRGIEQAKRGGRWFIGGSGERMLKKKT